MANPFFWYDVMTTDIPAAQKFYCDVVGWTAEDMSGSGQPYVVFHAAGRGVAGLMPIPHDAAGMPPAWMGYILVEDLDAKIEALKAAGGVLHKGPITIDGVIRFAVVSDPQGAGFLIAIDPVDELPRFPDWYHLGFCLSSEREALEMYRKCKSLGVKIVRDLMQKENEYASFFIADPDGNKLEISWHNE